MALGLVGVSLGLAPQRIQCSVLTSFYAAVWGHTHLQLQEIVKSACP